MSVKPTCCLISGASSDIGLACREAIASFGVHVIGLFNCSSNFTSSSALYDTCVKVNLESEDSIACAMKTITSSYCVTQFISLGSINEPSSLRSLDSTSLSRHFFVNSIAPLLIVKDIIPAMIDRSYGRIVLTSSVGVKFGGSISGLCYSMSKHASEFIPKELRDLSKYDVFTNVVRIGVTDTKGLRLLGKDLQSRRRLIPANRLALPSEIASFLVWLSSHNNSYMAGQIIDYSGGE